MKKYLLIAATAIFTTSSVLADNWDLGQNSVSVAIADVDWTVSPDFHGTKLLLGGRYVFSREAATAYEQPDAEILKYRIDLQDFQVGDSETDLEYVVAGFTYWTYQDKKADVEAGSFRTERTQLELLQFNASFDDSLGVDYYYELNAGKIGRFWSYRKSDSSPFSITFGLNGSLGWAWASSKDPRYADVSNPAMGIWNVLILGHDKWGQFYVDSRVVSGYTFGEPKSTTSREANARFGIRRDFGDNLALDFFGEKRSFHYAAFDIPDIYTKARRIALEVTYKF
ncbi:MAG: hypothetical protein HKO86_06780 [Gammaproteobacteria bacterium]|nr:hypothetical protein [Gammaproteobacteria bacterium]